MTPSNRTGDDPWESAMSRDFDARVRDLHEAPLTLGDIKGRAHSIRRRRRAVMAGGALAAAAVLVPTALMLGLPGTDNTRPDPVERPTETVEPLRSTAGYFDPATKTVHRPDGATEHLPVIEQVTVVDYTQLGDGRTVAIGYWDDHDGEGNPPAQAFVFTESDGVTVTEGYPMAGYGFRTAEVAPGRDAVAWLAPDATPMMLVSGVEDAVSLPRISQLAAVPDISLVGLTCDAGADAEDDAAWACSAVAAPPLHGPSYVSSTDGSVDQYAAESVLDVAPDGSRHLAVTAASEDEICVTLIAVTDDGDQASGEDCFFGMLGPRYRFSPDGEQVLANHGEGYGPAAAVILDGHTFEPRATAMERDEGREATYHQAVWSGGWVDLVVDYNQAGMADDAYEVQRLHDDGTVDFVRETSWIILETR